MAGRALPTIDQAPADAGACCAACATADRPGPEQGARPARSPVRLDRRRDRRITFGGLALAAGFVLASLLAATLGALWGATGLAAGWLPLHLLLAGAAGTAISAVLPFFTTALAAAAPAPAWLRAIGIGGVALGAAIVSASVAVGAGWIGQGAAVGYLVGLAAVAVAAVAPLRSGLGTRRALVERAYVAGIAQVAISVTIASAFLAGWAPVVERWAWLKPAHGWLNVVGFLSVVMVATLVHLGPTIEGGRIQPRRSAAGAVVGLAVGAPLVALGYALQADQVARAGAVAVMVGAAAVAVHMVAVARDHGRWTTDAAWHRFTRFSLRAGSVWFAVAVTVAAVRVLWLGADPAAWALDLVAVPLAIGWVLQVLMGSWSHLIPSIGPGEPVAHARQRRILGRAATIRLVALNAGVGLASVGVLFASTSLIGIGIGLTLAGGAAGLVTFGQAVWIGVARTNRT
jgi:nitrite reductase (NO-forming)